VAVAVLQLLSQRSCQVAPRREQLPCRLLSFSAWTSHGLPICGAAEPVESTECSREAQPWREDPDTTGNDIRAMKSRMVGTAADKAWLAPCCEPVAVKLWRFEELFWQRKLATGQHFQVGSELFEACNIIEGITADASSSYKNH